jgi:hypothetical protein
MWQDHQVGELAGLDGAQVLLDPDDAGAVDGGDANPLDDIRNTNTVRWVVKNGVVREGNTLREVWPGTSEIDPLWWW